MRARIPRRTVSPVPANRWRPRPRWPITTERDVSFGGAQAIIKLSGGWVAGSDPRKDGHAAGYQFWT